jgi:pimeloyl-ACP methyl ester carboxylesterase
MYNRVTMQATPTLVFIHGAGSNADFWHEQRAAFSDAHYLNLPGHGPVDGSRLPAGRLRSIEDYASWVESYVRDEGLQNVALNGHSMGGGVTLTLALRRPYWLRAIILTGTGARLRVLPQLLELLRTVYPAAVDLIIERSFAPAQGELTYAQKVRRNGTRRRLLRTPREITLADYQACDRFDVMDRVAEIDLPTLCIVGAQDMMTPPKYSRYLRERIEGSRLKVIDGAGHMLPLEKPNDYNRALAAYLAAL